MKQMATGVAHSQNCLETFVKRDTAHQEQLRTHEVLSSLFYPEILSRQEQVAYEFRGIENSYEWIFETPPSATTELGTYSKERPKQTRWANFSEWLRSGKDVYWINGKAGSGKSTLMNYIYEHDRKDALLKEWSAGRPLLTLRFFFWNAGVRQQKTVDGLLRSLIYQILKKYPELIACLKVS